MPILSDGLLADCQRVASALHGVKLRLTAPQPAILIDCEHELADVVSSLRTMHRSIAEDADAVTALRNQPVLRQTLQQIQRMAFDLNATFLHGSNFCAGLLQIRFGTGYSEKGLPVLVPGQPRNSCEG